MLTRLRSVTISPGKWKRIHPPDSLTITNAALSSKRPNSEDAGPDPRGCLEVTRDPNQQKEHGTLASFVPLVVPLRFRIVAKQEYWIRVKGPYEVDLLGHTYPEGTRDPLDMFAGSITVHPSSGKNTDSGAPSPAPTKAESAKPGKKTASASAPKRKHSESSNVQERRSQPLARKKTRSMASVAGTEGSGYAGSPGPANDYGSEDEINGQWGD
ncbi:hypothetical protein FA13DRAFT_1717860 [Coprinellus micaceus]|uniref:Nucleoplasmin-like domain-containing protein n=1 Tax=Coprinellus micaceus TaxID=71717 RepID=A0A4Y7SEZ1_COPMI|nr:hypothetical protein FA13DRAFT_1717860 [Coprinellus micaceus]